MVMFCVVGAVYLFYNVLVTKSIIWADFTIHDEWGLLQIGLGLFSLQVGQRDKNGGTANIIHSLTKSYFTCILGLLFSCLPLVWCGCLQNSLCQNEFRTASVLHRTLCASVRTDTVHNRGTVISWGRPREHYK